MTGSEEFARWHTPRSTFARRPRLRLDFRVLRERCMMATVTTRRELLLEALTVALIEVDHPGEGRHLFEHHAMLPYIERAEAMIAFDEARTAAVHDG